MFQQLKSSWKSLKRGKPGRRFQDRYKAHRQAKQKSSTFKRVLFIGGGIILVLVGLFLLVFPGPGMVFVFIGGGLLGAESLLIARLLDRLEVLTRKILAPLKRRWDAFNLSQKILTASTGALLGAAACWMFYRYVMQGAMA